MKEVLAIIVLFGAFIALGFINDEPDEAQRQLEEYCLRVAAFVHTDYLEACEDGHPK